MSYQTNSNEFAAAVTPSDATVLSFNQLFVGGAGNVVVTLLDGITDVTFTGVLAGAILPIRGTKVKAATTATNIVALW